jgi:hypothetical protein
MDWLLFLSQLPTQPSSLRVMVWRKMRAAGALGLQNGVWMLPERPEPVKFLEDLLASIQHQGASGQIFKVSPLTEAVEQEILARFRSERDEEYAEFCERCQGLLEELEKETAKEKFTFAELEENEQDLQKLDNWFEKIQRRDFVGGKRAQEAVQIFSTAKAAFETFSARVYARLGIEPTSPSDSALPTF